MYSYERNGQRERPSYEGGGLEKYKTEVFAFSDWGDFCEFVENGKALVNDAGRASRFTRERGDDYTKQWAGTSSLEEAMRLARDGWPEGRNKAVKLTNGMFDKISSLIERPTLTYDVEGSDYDLGLYLKGEPECWMKYTNEIESGQGSKIVKIAFNCGVSGGISTDVIIARGAAIAALIELMEYSGKRIELWVGDVFGTAFEWHACVKKADQPLDIDRVIFALAHPAVLRRLGFSVAECSPACLAKRYIRDGESGGYGPVGDFNDEDRGDIYIDRAQLGEVSWLDVASTKRWLLETLIKQGVPLERV